MAEPVKGSKGKGGFGLRMLKMLDRAGLASTMGISFGGKRNLWDAFGWPKQINSEARNDMYRRGGIAKRIVEAYPDSTWGRPPVLYSKDDVDWGSDFKELAWNLDLWSVLRAADVLARLGKYSIILIGTNRGSTNLETDIPRGGAGALKITYLQPYSDTEAKISAWEEDPTNPRFGLPKEYSISPKKIELDGVDGASSAKRTTPISSFKVHHSRVVHISAGGLQNKLQGIPVYDPIWNYLEDLQKVVGASSESYWRNSYQGLHANVDEEMDLDEADEAALTAEIDDYMHNYRRFIRTRGVDVKSLGTSVADPRGAFDVLITLISGTTGIPKRILLGSEAGQLASSQDKANWAERVEEYREMHAEPNVLWPFVMWCLNNKVIKTPSNVSSLKLLWPDAYRMSPLERAQQSAQVARSLANISKGLAPIIKTPALMGTDEEGRPQELAPAETEEALITRDEARRILGLSTDQQLLVNRPDEE